jgi:hypothetical protein
VKRKWATYKTADQVEKARVRQARRRADPVAHAHDKERLRTVQWVQKMQAIELMGGCCKDCGYNTNLNGLEFDHVMPHGLRAMGQLWGCTWEKVWAELQRCELVCSTCHSIRTAERRRVA